MVCSTHYLIVPQKSVHVSVIVFKVLHMFLFVYFIINDT